MAQSDNRNKNIPPNQPLPVDQEMIKSWLQNQNLELQNQRLENDLRAKEIDANTRLAEKSLEIQKAVLTNEGKEFRMTITRIVWLVALILMIILTFLGFCLWAGKDTFAYKFCQGISYLATTGLGYFFGRKNQTKPEKSNVIDDDQVF